MSWGVDFLAALDARTRAPLYLLEVVVLSGAPGTAYSAGSHRGLGEEAVIGSRGVQIQGPTLNPYDGSSSAGSFSVEIVGSVTKLLQHVTCGTFVRVLVGFAGMSASQFEPVALGRVQNLRGTGPKWTLECLDIFTGLGHRPTRTASQLKLFTGASASTTLNGAHAAGAATYTVGDSTSFDRESGGNGAFRVDSTLGDAYYRLYSAKPSSTTFTIASAGSDIMGTDDAPGAATGDEVHEVAYLQGHPMDIARRVLTSDGVVGNGSYDLYTATWGFGLPSYLIDNTDIDTWKTLAVKVSSGSYLWEYPQGDAVDDGIGWLQSFLSRGGVFLTTRQGAITCRATQYTLNTLAVTSGIEITDADIEEVEEYEAWASDHPTEYSQIKVSSSSNFALFPASADNIATFPGGYLLPIDLSDRVFQNETAMRDDVGNRLYESRVRKPERLRLRCSALRLAQLANGDIVKLTTRRVHSRMEGSGGFSQRNALVTEVATSIDEGKVRIGLHIYPTSDADFP